MQYTGTGSNLSFPHGLTKKPDFFIIRGTAITDDWRVWHKDLDATEPGNYYLILQNDNARSANQNASFLNRDIPTDDLIYLGSDSAINQDSNFISYIWHDVPGLQKFGSYGGADAFVELGFRPAVLIIKSLSNNRNWIIIDSARDTFNPSDRALLPNDSATEDDNSVYAIDFLSNGFKVRGSNGQIDGDTTYIYAAWAEAPSVNLYGGGANAR